MSHRREELLGQLRLFAQQEQIILTSWPKIKGVFLVPEVTKECFNFEAAAQPIVDQFTGNSLIVAAEYETRLHQFFASKTGDQRLKLKPEPGSGCKLRRFVYR